MKNELKMIKDLEKMNKLVDRLTVLMRGALGGINEQQR